jgi:hypothetical protein
MLKLKYNVFTLAHSGLAKAKDNNFDEAETDFLDRDTFQPC